MLCSGFGGGVREGVEGVACGICGLGEVWKGMSGMYAANHSLLLPVRGLRVVADLQVGGVESNFPVMGQHLPLRLDVCEAICDWREGAEMSVPVTWRSDCSRFEVAS
jgi:hypothetical protein